MKKKPIAVECEQDLADLWSRQSTPYLKSFTSAQDYIDLYIQRCIKSKQKLQSRNIEYKQSLAGTCRDERIPCLVPPCSSMNVCYDENGDKISQSVTLGEGAMYFPPPTPPSQPYNAPQKQAGFGNMSYVLIAGALIFAAIIYSRKNR